MNIGIIGTGNMGSGLGKIWAKNGHNDTGQPLCQVVSRDRQADANGDDPILSTLDRSDFDELWLFAVDTGDGISDRDCQGITGLRQRGGGILTTRDHMDLGSSLCNLAGVGSAHFFHTKNPDPDLSMSRPEILGKPNHKRFPISQLIFAT